MTSPRATGHARITDTAAERSPYPMSEAIAKAFHDSYERLAPSFGYRTREASAKPWDDVPEANKRLMIAVVYNLLADDVIEPGPEALR